jgi:hypothetical protein
VRNKARNRASIENGRCGSRTGRALDGDARCAIAPAQQNCAVHRTAINRFVGADRKPVVYVARPIRAFVAVKRGRQGVRVGSIAQRWSANRLLRSAYCFERPARGNRFVNFREWAALNLPHVIRPLALQKIDAPTVSDCRYRLSFPRRRS